MRIRSHRSPAAALVASLRHERLPESRATASAALLHLGTGLLHAGATSLLTMPTRAGDTTLALQVLPDSTLRGLAAASAGLGAGFFLTGVPRIVVIGAIVPALAAVAAIAARPGAPGDRVMLPPPPTHGRWRFSLRGHRSA
jgi:hypothetical protein